MGNSSGGFGDIQFGFASAEQEGVENPNLLLTGFIDESRITDRALRGPTFAFLGYKGAGKSALAQRARLLADTDPAMFVTVKTLDEFRYRDFKAAGGGGDAEHETRYPMAWSWLLLMQLIGSLEQDEGGKQRAPSEYSRAVKGLAGLGLMPVPELGLLAKTSAKKAFKAALPKILEFQGEIVATAQDLRLNQLTAVLKRVVKHFPTESRHVLFIDGLDAVVSQRDLQLQSLAALFTEAHRLNNEFRSCRRPFKVVVLCRTDIFDRLPGPNINKIRQDAALNLSWYDTPREPDKSRLLRMVNLRAKLSLNRNVNVFDEFFPPAIDGRETRLVVLDHTRHTPRDLVQAMRRVQEVAGVPSGPMSIDQVKDGLRAYSVEYLLPEMRNELAGYLELGEIENAIVLLTGLRRQRFVIKDLEAKAAELGLNKIDFAALVRALFNCSCLGTVRGGGDGERPLYTFKYRNPNAMAGTGESFWLHPGALKGLNIEVGSRRKARRARRGR